LDHVFGSVPVVQDMKRRVEQSHLVALHESVEGLLSPVFYEIVEQNLVSQR
jgi:hypothetical protein